ncbi:MAG: hypothetical protein QM817_09215 [Archangium sp.]
MNRDRGIDVFALVLVAVLLVEGVGTFLAQMSIWPGNHWVAVRFDFYQPWMPSTLAVAGALFALESVVSKRTEQAVFRRVVVGLIIAVTLALATVLGLATGVAHLTRPVG